MSIEQVEKSEGGEERFLDEIEQELVLPGFSGVFFLEILRAFRMERVLKQRHKAANWGGQGTNRFAPVLASLRCARPVEGWKWFVRKVARRRQRG
jgi:hypothetical protein